MRSTADTPPESDLCILHVDDEPGLGELVKLHLEREASGIDCRVTTVTSPNEALPLVRADGTDFDCLVSDYNMPG
ncbi:MAG: hypothetical protein ABEI99_00285, partial [Halobaculum sp.]